MVACFLARPQRTCAPAFLEPSCLTTPLIDSCSRRRRRITTDARFLPPRARRRCRVAHCRSTHLHACLQTGAQSSSVRARRARPDRSPSHTHTHTRTRAHTILRFAPDRSSRSNKCFSTRRLWGNSLTFPPSSDPISYEALYLFICPTSGAPAVQINHTISTSFQPVQIPTQPKAEATVTDLAISSQTECADNPITPAW